MMGSLSVLNEDVKTLKGPALFHDLINWERDPSSCALDFLCEDGSRQKYSYHELHACVSSLASKVSSLLLETSAESHGQPIIPILLPQSPALYVAIFATLNAGAAYCPITLDSPVDRIKFVVGDVSAKIIITTRSLEGSVTWDGGPRVIVIDEHPERAEGLQETENNFSAFRISEPSDLAYIMYTSGSTGKPKGVALSHLAVTQSLLAHDRHIPQFTRFLQFAAPSFDVSQFEIFFPLFRGVTLVGCHRPKMLNDLTGIINELEVDAAELTPTVAGSLLQKRCNVPRLKTLLTIGEMLTRPVVDEFGGSDSQQSMLFGMYGPTEAAIHCTINPSMHAGSKVSNIGIPFDTVSTYVVAIEEEPRTPKSIEEPLPVPRGEIGELVLGGPQLAREYLNRPEQNAVAFITINDLPAYRTGDKARMLEDGTIEILGRISSGQVKIRGQRAELGEIEEAVYKHPNIKMAVASVLDGFLIIFALERVPGTIVVDVLDLCSKWLPKYMIPSEILILESFPYLPSGKVDKRQLEANFRQIKDEELAEDESSQTGSEKVISRILRKIFNIKVRALDRLAAGGVDSLMAIGIASLLRKNGFQVSPVDTLQASTLQELALFCENHKIVTATSPAVSVDFSYLESIALQLIAEEQREEVDSVLPCTTVQDAMLSETEVDLAAYNNEVLVEVSNDISDSVIVDAVRDLAAHNPMLRSGFLHCPNSDSSYVQVVWKSLDQKQVSPVQELKRSGHEELLASIVRPLNIQISRQNKQTLLLIQLHHALYDGWSLELILDDLDRILSSQELKTRPAFSRVVLAELESKASSNSWARETYWKDHLAQFEPRSIPNFHIISDAPRGLQMLGRQTQIMTSDLDRVAKEHLISSQSIVQAAYALVLSSYLGAKDVTFGSVFSGRTAAIDGIEDIIGPCISTLPIRIDLDTVSTLSELVQQLHFVNRRHLEYSNSSLREIKKASGVAPGVSLFDSIFVWQQTLHKADHQRQAVKQLDSRDYLEFNLTLEVTPGVDRLRLQANYQTAVFPEAQIDLLLAQIESVISEYIKRSAASIQSAMATLTGAVLSIDNPKPETALGSVSLSARVEEVAATTPNKTAIEFAVDVRDEVATIQKMTYGELNSRANTIGHYLASIGAGPNELVCICLEKGPELYATVLAATKTGAGYLPVTPDTPSERIRTILPDAKVGIVVTDSMLGARFTHLHGVKIVYLDELECEEYSTDNLPHRSKSDDLGYCVFTSGSTGVPKGVLVTQGNLISNLEVLSEIYPYNADSRLLQSCSQAFDVSVFEIFFTWYIGACLCTASKDVLFKDIEMTIRALNVTHLSLTPTVASLIDPVNVPTVTFLVTAGEAVTERVFSLWADRGLYQGYGPSETTNICTVRAQVSKHHCINNIGRGFRNTSTFVLTPGDDFSIVPRGGEGEFCFGGAQVGRGYLDYKQSLGKFIEHPKYGKLYRSGDFGRMLADGSLAFSGRKDDQVKVRGFRIELGEINSMVLRSKEVKDCVTLVVDKENSQRLVTFWVPQDNTETTFRCLDSPSHIETIAKLYSKLSSSLQYYMVPSSLIPVSKLPLTSYSKIDKRLLLKSYHNLSSVNLDAASRSEQAASDHSWTETEKVIADAIAKISNVSREIVGPDTSIFALGIDSISAISLAKTLRQSDIHVEISDILSNPSVSRLAKAVAADEFNGSQQVSKDKSNTGFFEDEFLSSMKKLFQDNGVDVRTVLPCTPLQEAMLSAGEASTQGAYSNHTLLKLNVLRADFETAWSLMVKRLEILRTCFMATDNARYAYVQGILSSNQPDIQLIEARNVEHEIQDLQSQKLDPMQGSPPYRVTFIQTKHDLHVLLSMHHALYDGYALSILFSEIEDAIRGNPLAPSTSFKPFLREMASVDLERADMYWQKRLRNFRPTSIPRSTSTSTSTKPYTQVLKSANELSWIETQVKLLETSLLSVLQAVWSSVLSSMVQSSDVCFGNIVSGRTISVPGIDRLVAPCFNTVPVRLEKIIDSSFLDAFRSFQSQNVEGLPFQFTPLRRVQAKNSRDGKPLFETLLILQPPARELDPQVWSLESDDGLMDLPIVIEITPKPSDGALELILHSSHRVLSREASLSMLQSFDAILTKSLKNARHKLLSSEERASVSEGEEARRSENSIDNAIGGSASRLLTSKEMMIRNVFAHFSGVSEDRIKADTTIYRLGLDSINAVQIAAALRKNGEVVVASDVLQHPTIEQLASHLGMPEESPKKETAAFDFAAFAEQHKDTVCTKLAVAASDIEAIRPCTSVQNGMLAQTMHSEGKDYVNSFVMELIPGISLQGIRASWEKVAQRYEMLRTAFVATDHPKYPFAMVTFPARSDGNLPWFDDQESGIHTPLARIAPDFSKHVEQWPWKLEVIRNEDDETARIRFTAHHALYDAQSLEILLGDVAMAYDNGRLERPTPPAIGPLLGAIISAGDANFDESDRKAFWEKENKIFVNKFPDLTPLRQDSTESFVTSKSFSISLSRLETLCKQNDVSVQAAGQAAWARILSIYTGEPATTFGVTLSGRAIMESADLVTFPTIVTLPTTIDVSGSNTEILSRSMKLSARLHSYQHTPLILIQNWSGHSDGKMFDTLFAYQKTAVSNKNSQRPWKLVEEKANVDYAVSIELEPLDNGTLQMRLTAKESLVPQEQRRLILEQFDVVLQELIGNSVQKNNAHNPDLASDLLSITAAIQPTLPSRIRLLHEFVGRQAKSTADKVALEYVTQLDPFTSQRWTFSQLNEQGNRVAHLIQKLGIEQGKLIAICFDKCPEASFAILGILKAGCAYVALDSNAPADRVKFILEDSKSTLVFSTGRPYSNLAQAGLAENIQIVDLGGDNCLSRCSGEDVVLGRPIDAQETSYCLYTSGTTGTPKGCLLSHENAVQAMLSFQHLFAGTWNDQSRWLTVASWHFDVSVLEQYWSWSVGIRVVCAPRDLIFEDIPGTISQLKITHIDLTPSLARLVQPEDVPSLWNGVFITGGEQLKQEILDVWGEKGCIYNGYGPTEATIGCTMFPRVPANGKPANIGPAFLNVGSYVLKPGTNEPVARGGVGELCVSGKLVGKGYLNRPELTKERFPYLLEFGERVYRTGDLVRILHDNSFLFLGRADDQVKLRGQRIQLSEGNEVMKKYVDGLDEVVTLVLKHAKQQKEQLVTFFVPKSSDKSASSLISSMRDTCKDRLPPYMVPTHFIPLKTLPLSPNNKADAKQLAKMYDELSVEELQKLNTDVSATRQWSQSEMKVLEVIAAAIGNDVEALTSSTTIFELGVDSISVIGLSRMLQKAGYHNAQLSSIMRTPSMGSLVNLLISRSPVDAKAYSAHVAAKQNIAAFSHTHKATIASELGVDGDEVESIAPCTPSQEGMIYRLLDSEDNLYYNTFQFLLNEGTDAQRLKDSWEALATKLQILRTKFVLTGDGCAQVVLKTQSVKFGKKTHRNTSDILISPWTVSFGKRDEKDLMTLSILHTLYDGMSLPLLFTRLGELYHGSQSIEYGPDFQNVLPYGPLAKAETAEVFWKKTLQNIELSLLPRITDDIYPKTVHVSKSIDSFGYLDSLRQQLGVTYQAILQAAWSSALQQSLQSSNISFGLVVSGRSIDFEGADQVIGPLLNTIVFQTSLSQGLSWEQLIRFCHDYNTDMLPYQHTALKDIQKWCGAGPGQSLFDSIFVFQREEKQAEDQLWQSVPTEAVADYPLAFEAQLNANNSLVLTIVGQRDFINEKTATSLLEQTEIALKALQDPQALVAVGSEMSTHHRRQMSPAPASQLSADKRGEFQWTDEAKIIRDEIKMLAKVDDVSGFVSLFELGLDSIDMIKLSSRLKKRGIQLSVSSIIRSQTIAGMIGQIISASSNQNATIHVSIEKYQEQIQQHLKMEGRFLSSIQSVLPATSLQEGMVAEMVTSEYTRYFNHELYQVHEEVDPQKLKEAWKMVIKKNDILRTTFVEISSPEIPMSYAQIISFQGPAWETIKALPEDLESATQKAMDISIDAAKDGNLLGLKIIDCGTKTYFLLSISHALYDGFSLQTLHEDVAQAYYSSTAPQRPAILSTLEDVIRQDGPEATKFWKTSLSGLPPSVFPRRQEYNSELHRYQVTSEQPLSRVQEFCRSKAISMQTLSQCCWSLLLAHYQQALDVVFGAVLSCRDTDEANQLMFPLMNTVAVRSVLHGTIEQMLKYMQENANAIRQFQHFPLRKAQALSGTRESGLFDTLFIFQGQQRVTQEQSKPLYEAVSSVSEVEFPVCVEVEIVEEKFIWRTACKDIARSSEETQELLASLDKVLCVVMNESEHDAIAYTPQGISICGLPPFKTQENQAAQASLNGCRLGTDSPEDSEWSTTEEKIREVLSQVSQIPQDDIDRDQTIFHLGLDSISAIKVSSILRKQGMKLGVQDIMRNNSIRLMANFLNVSSSEEPIAKETDTLLKAAIKGIDVETALSNAKISIEAVESVLPVSAGQLYMLSRWQESGGSAFAANFEYEIKDVDIATLESAWTALVAKHPILRTKFLATSNSDSPFIQAVMKPEEGSIQMNGAANLSLSSINPVHLVASRSGADTFLHFHLLHAIYDAISLPLLIRDLQQLMTTPISSLPESRFKDFLAQALDVDQDAQNTRKLFWKNYLKDVNSNTKVAHSSSTKRVEVFRPSMDIGNLTKVAQQHGLSVDALILAVLAKYTQQPSGMSSSALGVYLSNRSEFPGLAAPTLNLLPISISRGPIFEAAKRLQTDLSEISNLSIIGSSLKEIYDWTGVRVNTFANIWKAVSDGEETSKASSHLEIVNSKHQSEIRKARADIVETYPDEKLGEQMKGWVKEVYPTSIDFELKLNEDGTLDVGVFGPQDMISLERAIKLIEELRKGLVDLK